jgi:hypothetical protein
MSTHHSDQANHGFEELEDDPQQEEDDRQQEDDDQQEDDPQQEDDDTSTALGLAARRSDRRFNSSPAALIGPFLDEDDLLVEIKPKAGDRIKVILRDVGQHEESCVKIRAVTIQIVSPKKRS